MTNECVRHSILLEPVLDKELKEIAANNNISFNALVNYIIGRFIFNI